MSKDWQIQVSWEMSGVVNIKADAFEEAIELAKHDESVALPPGDYVDGSFSVSFDNPDGIRMFYNNNQPDEICMRQAIRDFMEFEKKTSIIYPFASDFEELSAEYLLKIEEKCNGDTDAETIYAAIEEVVGANPQLKDRAFVAIAFAAYQKRHDRVPLLNELIQSAKSNIGDPQPVLDDKGKDAELDR